MKPSPVLIAPLQIKIGRPFQIRTLFKYCGVAHAGIKPYIQDVIFFYKCFITALLANSILWKKSLCIFIEPDICAMLFKFCIYPIYYLLVYVKGFALFTIKYGDGNTPGTLPLYAPVRPIFNHSVDPFSSPVRYPRYPVYLFK